MTRHRSAQWRHTITATIEVGAPDQDEAGRRIQDALDAITERFAGIEVYRRYDGGPRRIAGRPIFRWFRMAPGRPVEVDQFEEQAVQG